jgi:hypothetical protein
MEIRRCSAAWSEQRRLTLATIREFFRRDVATAARNRASSRRPAAPLVAFRPAVDVQDAVVLLLEVYKPDPPDLLPRGLAHFLRALELR